MLLPATYTSNVSIIACKMRPIALSKNSYALALNLLFIQVIKIHCVCLYIMLWRTFCWRWASEVPIKLRSIFLVLYFRPHTSYQAKVQQFRNYRGIMALSMNLFVQFLISILETCHCISTILFSLALHVVG